jgi:hypothetical protein
MRALNRRVERVFNLDRKDRQRRGVGHGVVVGNLPRSRRIKHPTNGRGPRTFPLVQFRLLLASVKMLGWALLGKIGHRHRDS